MISQLAAEKLHPAAAELVDGGAVVASLPALPISVLAGRHAARRLPARRKVWVIHHLLRQRLVPHTERTGSGTRTLVLRWLQARCEWRGTPDFRLVIQ